MGKIQSVLKFVYFANTFAFVISIIALYLGIERKFSLDLSLALLLNTSLMALFSPLAIFWMYKSAKNNERIAMVYLLLLLFTFLIYLLMFTTPISRGVG